MKNLKNLKGANELSKNEQKSINGGKMSYQLPANCYISESECNAAPSIPHDCYSQTWATDDFGSQTTIYCWKNVFTGSLWFLGNH